MSARAEVVSDEPTFNTCLVGTLETWPLADLLVWLHQSRRTAMVRIGSGAEAGVVFFREGTLVRCEWRSQRGEEALIGLLGVARGSFALIQRSVPEVRPNIARPTPELLLQCTIALDEGRRVSRA